MPRQQQHLQPQPQQQQDVQQDISSNIQGTRPVSSLPLAPDVPAAVAAASELRTAVADAGPLTTAAAATSQAAVPRSSSMVRLLRTSSSGTLRMDAAAAAPGSGGGMPVEALGLQREMRLLAARLAEMTQTMAKLQQVRQRVQAFEGWRSIAMFEH